MTKQDIRKIGKRKPNTIGHTTKGESMRDLEDIKADICDHYCKYPESGMDYDEMLDEVCANCPLGELDNLEDKE